jgi:hypothetical protein
MKYLLSLCLLLGSQAQAQQYWQQRVDTRMEVTLDDRQHMLYGHSAISYTNNSPDTLRYIYIHLWPNAYKHDRTAFAEQQVRMGKTAFYYAPAKDRGYIDSINFNIDGEPAEYYYAKDNPDVARIDLAKPLLPGATMQLTTPFRVKLPKVFSRLGHTGQAYYVSQWFPKPAVYDQKGWHPLPYLDQGEFYSEIGSYDVSIKVPQNYIVMATGNCQNPEEEAWLDSLSTVAAPVDTMYRKSWPASSTAWKTLRFTEDNIHDFAWFADKRWIVRKDTVLGNGNEGMTALYTAFLPAHAKQWASGTKYLKSTIEHYGNWVGKYPYKTMKAVEGDMSAGGGMEYPTITVIDRTVASSLQTVIVHEAGHNWFYGILASNEREHAWMDEGINTFYEQKTNRDVAKTDSAGAKSVSNATLESLVYFQSAAMNEDQSLALDAASYSNANYGGDVYYKSAMALRWLEDYMGEAAFTKAMQAYYDTWKHRHPYPEDFKAIMQQHSTRSLDWFFDGIMRTDRRVDFALRSVKGGKDKLNARVVNRSDFAAPVKVNIYEHDSLVASAWTEPFAGKTKLSIDAGAPDWTRAQLESAYPDIRVANDDYKRGGLFHKGGISLHGPVGDNRQKRDRLFIAPALGYNVYDGIGLGLLLHNITWPQNRFQYALAPMYSFKSGQLNGTGSVAYSWYPAGAVKEIRLQGDVKSFSNNETGTNIPDWLYTRYIKAAPYLQFVFRSKNPLSTVTRRLTLKEYIISEDYFNFSMSPVDSLYRPSIKNKVNNYTLLRYEHINNQTFHPFSYSFEAQMGENFAKLGFELNKKINYDVKNKALYIRAYAGKFITINSDPGNSRYYLNTTFSGVNDYLYDGTYLGRNEQGGTSARQVSMQEGGFKIPTNYYANPLGRSDNWLLAVNLKTDLPLGKLPIRFFLDAGTFADAKNINPNQNLMSYVGGLELHLFYDLFSLNVPLFMSEDYTDYLKSMYGSKRFEKSISFSLNIQNINWLRMPGRVFKFALQ